VRNSGTWSQQAYLKASSIVAFESYAFGISVAVSGDTIAVGATGESSNAVGVNGNQNSYLSGGSGAAYVFVRSSGTWSQQAYLKASNTGARDSFGTSVAASGDTVVVGAPLEDSSAVGVNGDQTNNLSGDSGAAYVFVRSGGNWSQQAYLKASNTRPSNKFGTSVAVSGDSVVIGAGYESGNIFGMDGNGADNNSGAAYVFVRSSGGMWNQQAYLKASYTGAGVAGDFFGNSVAISGRTVISGAAKEDSITSGINTTSNDVGAPNDSGAAYIFTLPIILPITPPVTPPVADTLVPLLNISGKVPASTSKKDILIQGAASDASGIRSVQYAIGKNPLKTAIGTTAWQIKPALKKGKNEISITATDNAGNVSAKTVIKIKRK
jgi:FG-GAP repeat